MEICTNKFDLKYRFSKSDQILRDLEGILLMVCICLTSFTTYFTAATHNGTTIKGVHAEKDRTKKTQSIWL